jgi:hypothetical protein
MSKFSKLFALASKATGKAATLTRKVEGEGSVSLRFDSFPTRLTADGFAELAQEKGGRVLVTAVVGEGVGKASGVLGTAAAAEMVRVMTSDDTEPARKPAPRNGKPEPAAATA